MRDFPTLQLESHFKHTNRDCIAILNFIVAVWLQYFLFHEGKKNIKFSLNIIIFWKYVFNVI